MLIGKVLLPTKIPMFSHLPSTIFGLGLLLLSIANTHAHELSLNSELSSVHFVSTKNAHISEIHNFTNLSGTINRHGLIHIDVDLASVQTGIEIRNQRMREKLFDLSKFASASIEANMPKAVSELNPGESKALSLPATLSIMGIERKVELLIQVSKSKLGQLTATSIKPLMIIASDYGLNEGIDVLKGLAGLNSISYSVPLNFNVVFESTLATN